MQAKERLVHILTGDGNGKTTSAVGLALRACGRGMKVAFIQFLKGGFSSEIGPMKRLGIKVISATKFCPNAQKHKLALQKSGEVFFCRDCFAINKKDRKKVAEAFRKAKSFSRSGKFDMVVLDEIFWAVLEGLISEEQLLSLITSRHPSCELVLTGRGASQKVQQVADYVSYVSKIRHPFDKGMLARAGIDY
ncbi:MAG: cob(I)yrinic acid a,c-diamide adenosyltransferase [Candidatus Micrarchaeota archaeon]|nr:cob(I)yrinic acid a,c-diamide adenosyltransferase [Candidatus Micrarchaeota archaeon]